MNNFDDSSFEMHDDSLSAEEVEALIDGTSVRPDLGQLETLFAEVRALPNRTEIPEVSAALAEFVGVDLAPNPEPIELRDVDETVVLSALEAPSAQPVRRNSMIGQAVAFLGTIGGKLAIGTTVAAASLGGAHATGAIDVPYLPDNEPAKIETVDLPDDPDALAFVEHEQDHGVDEVVEVVEEESKDEQVHVEKEPSEESQDKEAHRDAQLIEDDFPSFGSTDEFEEKKKAEAEAEAEAEAKKLAEEKAEEDKAAKKKAEEKKAEEKKAEEKKAADKTEADKAKQEELAALEEAVHKAKDEVRAEATALIKPLEEERDGLLADLEEAHHVLAQEWEPVIDALRAELEETDGEEARAALEADIDAAENAWIAARIAAELEVDPRLEEINDLFEVIETERDAEIDRLLEEYFAAVDAIKNT